LGLDKRSIVWYHIDTLKHIYVLGM
jgi:hypothetical protein